MKKNLWRKGLVLGIIMLFVGASVIPSVLSGETQKMPTYMEMGTIWYVDDDGVDCPNPDFNTIQEAIDAASAGDEIRVCKGFYQENLLVSKSLALIGGWNGTATVNGSGVGNVVTIDASRSVEIENFNITNSGDYDGRTDFDAGIHISGGEGHEISGNNIVDNNGAGIYISNSRGIKVSDNLIADNAYDGISQFGIASIRSSYTNNTVQDNGLDGIYLFQGFKFYISENTIMGNGMHGIHLHRTRSVPLDPAPSISMNCIANNAEHGIFLEIFCFFNRINENNITGNDGHGIFLKFQCEFNTIWANNFIDNKEGNVCIQGSFLNNFRENYWDDWIGFGPYKIIWVMVLGFIPLPIIVDLFPQDEPYPYPSCP